MTLNTKNKIRSKKYQKPKNGQGRDNKGSDTKCKTRISNMWCYKLQNKTQDAKNKNQNIPPTIAMKELSCFGSFKLSLSLYRWCIRQK